MTDSLAHGNFGKNWPFPKPFRYGQMLRYSASPGRMLFLPLNIEVCFRYRDAVRRDRLDARHSAEESFNAYSAMEKLLTTKSPIFVKDTKVSNFNLLFGHGKDLSTSANFKTVFLWLLAVSTWEANIQAFDTHLEQLSNKAMAKPSLETFRPIPALRQNVADMRDSLQITKATIGESDTTAFIQLEEILGPELESLDSVFKILLQRTNALSAKASNEIQLVIGSVTIQVPFSY